MMDKKRKVILMYLLTIVIPLILFLTSTGINQMLPGQERCFIYGDALTQFVSIPKDFWRDFFEQGSLIYSFSNGMGMPTVAINAFDAMSPFNALCYFIKDPNTSFFCIVCLKMMCSAVAMLFLLRKLFDADDLFAVFFSVSYALCSYFSYFYVALFLTEMLYIMPIIVLALVRFVRTGRWGWLCIIYTYSFIVQFYCAYIMGISSAVIFIAYAWYQYGRDGQLWKRAIVEYSKCVLIAVFIASPVLVPAAYELFSMRTSDVLTLESYKLLPWSLLAGLFPGQAQEVHNDIPYIYAGLIVLMLAIAFFIDKRNEKRERICAGIPLLFLGLCFFIKPLYLFMHAFDAPNWYLFRFSWLFVFGLVIIAYREVKTIKEYKGRGVNFWWISGILILTCLFVWGMQQIQGLTAEKTMTFSSFILSTFLLAVYAIAIKYCDRRVTLILIGTCVSIELFFNLFEGQTLIRDKMISRQDYVYAKNQEREGLERISAEEERDPWKFFRIKFSNSITDNVATEYGVNGLGYYRSIEDENNRNMLAKYGYSAVTLRICDYGSTQLMQMLFSQKYDIDCGFCMVDTNVHKLFEKNKYTLPIGYMVNDELMHYHTDVENPFEAQNLLVSAMCGEAHEVYVSYNGVCYTVPENIEFVQYDEGVKLSLTGKTGMVTYMVSPETDERVYAYMRRWGLSSDTNSPYIYSNIDKGDGIRPSMVTIPHIIPLDRDNDGFSRLFIYMDERNAKAFDYENIFFACENELEIEKVYNSLSVGGMDVTFFRDDRIEGNVNVSRDKTLMFTSIPYNEGWQVYVDGERTETLAVLDDAFLGVMLEEGEHELLFVYKSKWVTIGCAIGAVGILLFIFAMVRNKKAF